MNGVDIVSSTVVFNDWVVAMFISLVVCIGMISYLIAGFDTFVTNKSKIIFCALLSVAVGLTVFFGIISRQEAYNVHLHGNVDITEFNEKYEVRDINDGLYVVVER